jgi:hypothetical protein
VECHHLAHRGTDVALEIVVAEHYTVAEASIIARKARAAVLRYNHENSNMRVGEGDISDVDVHLELVTHMDGKLSQGKVSQDQARQMCGCVCVGVFVCVGVYVCVR